MSKVSFYPALKSQMGDWEYYITQMTMSDLIREVKTASEFGAQENQVDILAQARQRMIAEKRVRGPIVEYLQQKHRFFSSIVVATMGGKPTFYPVSVAEDTVGNVIAGTGIDKAFGVLRLEGKVDMYALDGQHRLSAIKCILSKGYRKEIGVREEINVPPGFAEEHISVIMIIRKKSESEEEFLSGYRRLFSNLNRHAQKTGPSTNVIMDEDDASAILTRRLISRHSFFNDRKKKEVESTRVKMKGKNLNSGDPQFTAIETLYDTTRILLNVEEDKIRPSEDELDSMYKDLSSYWDAILDVLPELHKEPLKVRQHPGEGHMFFRPIGQKMLAEVVRALLNLKFSEKKGTAAEMKKCLKPLAGIDWNVHHCPWNGVVTVLDGEGYVMRNESRDKAMKVAKFMALYMAGDTNIDLENLRKLWKDIINLDSKIAEKKWKEEVLPLLTKKKK